MKRWNLQQEFIDTIENYKGFIFGSDAPICQQSLNELRKEQLTDQETYLESLQWHNWGGALGAIATPLRKNLPFLNKYENQSKLYVDMNGLPVLALFSKNLS